MGEPGANAAALLEALLTEPTAYRAGTSAELQQLGPLAVSPLCAALREEQSIIRSLHLQLDHFEYARTGDPEWRLQETARIRREIEHHVERVCRVARVLEAIRDREAVQPLYDALRRSGTRESHALALALARQGPPALPVLGEALDSRLLWVAMNAAEALAIIGGEEAASLLRARFETATHDLLRACLIRGLGRLRDEGSVELLCEVARGGREEERSLAAEALGRIGDPRAVETLSACLAVSRSSVREPATELRLAAARALGALPVPGAVVALTAALRQPSPPLFHTAAEALGRIAEREAILELRAAIPLLRDRLRRHAHDRDAVRAACRTTLQRIETATATLKDLPVPAGPAAATVESLPLPAGDTTTDPASLPVTSEERGAPELPALFRWRARR